MQSFFRFIDQAKTRLIPKVLYWTARYGLGLAFVVSGMRKFPGIKFTILPLDNPVGFYFHAMHETGFYWNFIGYFQVLVGLLIYFKRLAPLSTLLMMPITVNIFLVSIALRMQGTPFITSMMLLGNLYLLLWYWKHYIGIITPES